jgi:hypothetical protein
MSTTAKSVILDIADNYGDSDFVGVRFIEFFLAGTLIGITTEFTAYATTNGGSGSLPAFAFNTSLSKTGSAGNTAWTSTVSQTTNQRLIIVFDTPTEFDDIVVSNYFSVDGFGVARGIKNVVITSSTDAITDTTYNATVANSTILFNGVVDIHVASEAEDIQSVYAPPPSLASAVCLIELSGVVQESIALAQHVCNLELASSVEVIRRDVYPSGAFTLSGVVDATLGRVAKIDGSLVLRSDVGIETYNDYINAGFRLSSRVDTFSEKPVSIAVGLKLSSNLEALAANAVAIHSDLVLSSDLSIVPGDINNIIGKLVLTNSLNTAKHLSIDITGNFVLGIKSSALAESSILAGGTTCSIPVHSSSRWS